MKALPQANRLILDSIVGLGWLICDLESELLNRGAKLVACIDHDLIAEKVLSLRCTIKGSQVGVEHQPRVGGPVNIHPRRPGFILLEISQIGAVFDLIFKNKCILVETEIELLSDFNSVLRFLLVGLELLL